MRIFIILFLFLTVNNLYSQDKDLTKNEIEELKKDVLISETQQLKKDVILSSLAARNSLEKAERKQEAEREKTLVKRIKKAGFYDKISNANFFTDKTFKEILQEGLTSLQKTFGFGVLINDPSLFFSLTQSKGGLLKGNLRLYTLILSCLLFSIILFSDGVKFVKSKGKEELSKEFSVTKMTFKYMIILSIILLPNFFTSVAITIRNIIAEPMVFLVKQDVVKSREDNINLLKVYNYYSSMVYDDFSLFGDSEEEAKNDNGETIIIDRNSLDNFFTKKATNTFYALTDLLYSIQDIASFVLSTLSLLLVYLCAVFFPLAILLEFLPGFSGAVTSIIKYIVSFSLWGVITESVYSISSSFGMDGIRAKIYGIMDALVPYYNSGDIVLKDKSLIYAQEISKIISDSANFGNLLIILMLTFILFIVPKISDMLISGSQSGSFFSAMTGMATMAIKKVATGGLSMGKSAVNFTSGLMGKGKVSDKMGANVMGGVARKGIGAIVNKAKGLYGGKGK